MLPVEKKKICVYSFSNLPFDKLLVSIKRKKKRNNIASLLVLDVPLKDKSSHKPREREWKPVCSLPWEKELINTSNNYIVEK
jgi:hypothetical protein